MVTSPPTSSPSQRSYSPQDWLRGYQSQPQEWDYWVEDVEGSIPLWLQGTLYRNGPGLLEIGDRPLKHPFDGDGMVTAFKFPGDGRVHFQSKFVRTQGYVEEQKAGKMIYRGVFGSQPAGGWLKTIFDLRLKNIANTNITYWGDRLLALWEGGQPHRLEPSNLATIGLDDLGGILAEGQPLSAHPRIDPASTFDGGQPCYVTFSIKSSLSSTLTLLELDPQGKLLRQKTETFPGFAFIHDFAITPHYAIFLQNNVTLNGLPYLFGLRGAGECVQFHPDKPAQIILVPRDGGEIKRIPVQAGFVFHHANAFEENGKIILDSICYNSLPQVDTDGDFRSTNFDNLDPGQLWRFTIDPAAATVEKQLMVSRCCEFPVVHPQQVGRPYRYVYMGAAHHSTGNAPLQAILKVDLESGTETLRSFAPHGFAGEPIFVSHPGALEEDDGVLLCLIYKADLHRSELVILNAKDITAPAIATLKLKHHIPYPLHGSWAQT
uniref:Apocarotenoid-15,15'-oxygenase n=1 Tax=Synechocystis sp. (strain ATCC 27184 / PCC 6803 / Kazusa) TaxID=1111708 RepID=UPI000D5032FE|nr:Chain A, Apocarotenoid-15,15'-oxygenase [Synechocystis sp. PCC 6803 substr. Kazusa]6C7O_B Chain B, Apocarotenoid-15,15'-oxygenase [Synechocystis sp. PCC 6803 substr. Kazusa]6C7P_A Chain A, Apocarotenoid-15,15'-oxygenase [Synechocystis sp. PCC 6803 substr. Kazusa]6C7P_B Chain B, Apocarotenoid-15,15'-oxygenase [Synechocystis sp. PCC 6803 substr. Kazusa]